MSRPEAALFALALGAYAYFYQAGGWNQNSRFDLVRAVVERGTASIEGYHHNTGDHSRKDGVHYCDKAPGASWLGVPVYAVARAAGGEPPTPRFLAVASYAVTVVAVGVPSAVAVVALCALVGALGVGRGPAIAIAAAYAFGTLAFPYATLFYGHQLMAALVVIGFAVAVRTVRAARAGTAAPRFASLFGAGLALGYAVVVEYPAALAVAPIAAYVAWGLWRDHRRAVAWFVAGGAGPAAALAAYHWIVFGGPLTLPYAFSTQPHRGQGFMGIGAPRDGATWGVLFSSYRGLFFSAPWLLVGVPGWAWMAADRRWRAEALVCAAAGGLFVWLNVSLVDWQGGWALGPRYLIGAIPFFAVGVAGWVLKWPARAPRGVTAAAWLAFAAAAGYSTAAMLAGTAVKPEVDVRIRHPFGDFVWPHFARGELAVSRQGIDDKHERRGGPPAAWNLGHLLGLSGLASLLPLAGWAAVCLAWLVRALRRSRDGPPAVA
ncbi:MAG: hypothetical protein D6689_17115 [Deltaproteobacteria bacterium]|nr:MAG: hypothetical protein D6689_17115 [Deltaproteobacteria bacterium]